MLSIARSAGIGAKQISHGRAAVARKTAMKNSHICTSKSSLTSTSTRSYARWSKIIGRMSPEALAKMRESSKQGQRQGHAGISIKTSNTVGDPWLAPRMSSPFAGKFWSDMINWGKHIIMNYIASPYRIGSVSKQLKLEKLTKSQVREACKETYIKYSKTLATFQFASMGNYVSDTVMKNVRQKFGKTVLPHGTKAIWEHSDLKAQILNYVVVQVPAPLNMHFLQVTMKFTSKQKFAVFDQSGNVLLGKDEFKPVEDIWVLEKILEKPDNPWYIIATELKHPDDVAAPTAPQ